MTDRLLPGQALTPGQELDALVQPVRCLLQTDGNLVIYWGSSGVAIWAANTAGLPVTQAIMQTDGNFVVYAGTSPLWATGTAGNPGAQLVVQDNGQLVVLSPSGAAVLWQSGPALVFRPQPPGNQQLSPGESIGVGQAVQSGLGPFALELQSDGSLALIKLGSQVLWRASGPQPAQVAIMQTDGNFVMYAADGTAVWSTGTWGNPGAVLQVDTYGPVVIWGTDGQVIWTSGPVEPHPAPYWAFILCKFSDIAAEPQDPSWYVDYFVVPDAGGAGEYWMTVTNGVIDTSGCPVFGWFTMNHSTAELAGMTFPGDRHKLVEWGRETAEANGIDLSEFTRVLVVLNFTTDGGAIGVPGDVVITHGNPEYMDLGFVCHEMGHGYGLAHSWSASPDMEYGDGFDLMSFNTTTYDFLAVNDGVVGNATVGLNAHNLLNLGALVPGQYGNRGPGPVAVQPAGPDFSELLELTALTQTPRNLTTLGNLTRWCAYQVPQADGSSFLFEARRKAQWDRAIPVDNVVLAHQVRTNGLSYLYPVLGEYLTTGQLISTIDPVVTVSVGEWDGDLVRLWAWDLPDGCLRQEVNDSRVYLIDGGQKRWVVNPATLAAIEASSGRVVRPVANGGLAGLAAGPYVALLNVSTTPHPPARNQAVTVTVTATDPVTNAAVTAAVEIDGTQVGTTGVPFDYTFTVFPRGWQVTAAGYLPTPIDWGIVPVVPNVRGEAESQAIKDIDNAGLVALVKFQAAPDADGGTVLSQAPGPDTVLQPDAIVTIWVAKEAIHHGPPL